MKRYDTLCLRLRETAALALVLGLLLTSGCVTSGTYRLVVDERDELLESKVDLEQRVRLLTASNQSLGAERLKLLDEMEDLLQARSALEVDIRKLQRTEAILSGTLREREAKLASRGEELRKLQGTYEGLVADLQQELADGQIEIEQLRSGIRLNLAQDVLFASGSAELSRAGTAVVNKVAGRLKTAPYRIQVQGHTDPIPIRSTLRDRFPTNWELAAARASQVVRLLAKQGVRPDRLRAVSFGQYRPVASNQTADGRAKNRRIEIRLEPLAEAHRSVAPADPSSAPAAGAP